MTINKKKLNYKITAYSTALFSTWINIEELSLLFDAGDGVTAGLLQKSRKIKHVFITHPDRDHVTGLLQFNQLNSREGFPKIYYPKDSGSFPAMKAFQAKFDPHVAGSEWLGIKDQAEIDIKKNIYVQAIRNEHIKAEKGVHKSLSYKVFETKKKLKPEFHQFNSKQIQEIANTKGRDFLTQTLAQNVISFSGDTPVDDYEKWNHSDILIHESTFIKNEDDANFDTKRNKHSTLDEVCKMVSEIEVGKLILTHFSSRYSQEEIRSTILNKCKAYQIKIPVYAIYPGQIHRDILKSNPLNS